MQIAHQFRQTCLQVVRGIGRHARIPGFVMRALDDPGKMNLPTGQTDRRCNCTPSIGEVPTIRSTQESCSPSGEQQRHREKTTDDGKRSKHGLDVGDQFGAACFNDGPSQRHLRRIGLRMSLGITVARRRRRGLLQISRAQVLRVRKIVRPTCTKTRLPFAHVGRWLQECDFCRRCCADAVSPAALSAAAGCGGSAGSAGLAFLFCRAGTGVEVSAAVARPFARASAALRYQQRCLSVRLMR